MERMNTPHNQKGEALEEYFFYTNISIHSLIYETFIVDYIHLGNYMFCFCYCFFFCVTCQYEYTILHAFKC